MRSSGCILLGWAEDFQREVVELLRATIGLLALAASDMRGDFGVLLAEEMLLLRQAGLLPLLRFFFNGVRLRASSIASLRRSGS